MPVLRAGGLDQCCRTVRAVTDILPYLGLQQVKEGR